MNVRSMDEIVAAFKKLPDVHQESLRKAAVGRNEEIWVNICRIYRFDDHATRSMLRKYITTDFSKQE